MPTIPKDVIAAARDSAAKWRIPASVTLAQWAIESGWGAHMPAGSCNPFGIKAVGLQPSVTVRTREVAGDGREYFIDAPFRKFGSLAEAFDAHARLLANGAPYAHARTLLPDADRFADALTGVYATDPQYGAKLRAVMASAALKQLDAAEPPVVAASAPAAAPAPASAPQSGLAAFLALILGLFRRKGTAT